MNNVFCFGSNLSKAQLKARVGKFEDFGQARLDGFQIQFVGRGVATVAPSEDEAPTAAVAGVMVSLTDDQLAALDRYEGVSGGTYRREMVTIRTPGDSAFSAWTYIHSDQAPASPSAEYLGRIFAGYRDHNLGDFGDVLRAAYAAGYRDHVFVYGSLKRGKHNHGLLTRSKFVQADQIQDRLVMVNLGSFPALIPAAKGDRIAGEVFEVSEAVMRDLDRLEGYPTFYDRRLVITKNGTLAWVYIMPERRNAYRRIKPNHENVVAW